MEKPKSKQPIPDHAKKVFSGVMFDVYQWEQEMYDGSKKIFEKIKRPDTTDIIAFTEDGKIIVLDQEQPGKQRYYSLPGGRIEEGEDPIENAKRELLEETGFESGEIKQWHSTISTNKIDWVLHFFVAKGCKKVTEQNLDGGEKIKVLLVSFEEFFDMVLEQKIKSSEIIMKMLKDKLLVIDEQKTIEKLNNAF